MSGKRRFSPSKEVLSGETADVYFLHARRILEAEGSDADVTMEVFPSRDGILCGIKEVRQLLKKVLSPGGEAWGIPEGKKIEKREVTLRISGSYREFGIYETAILGILAQERRPLQVIRHGLLCEPEHGRREIDEADSMLFTCSF